MIRGSLLRLTINQAAGSYTYPCSLALIIFRGVRVCVCEMDPEALRQQNRQTAQTSKTTAHINWVNAEPELTNWSRTETHF